MYCCHSRFAASRYLGTDSGVKFIGPNQETNPTELIHYITKRKSLNQENSFSVHGNKVPPLAKMIFHLVNTKGKCSKRFRLKSTPGLKGNRLVTLLHLPCSLFNEPTSEDAYSSLLKQALLSFLAYFQILNINYFCLKQGN